jgi:hypothetical protein
LQNGEGFHSAVEVFGEKVPEDFGPEEGFEGSGYLIYKSRISTLLLIVLYGCGGGGWVCDLQAAAVKTTRRAQWFLINLPILNGD